MKTKALSLSEIRGFNKRGRGGGTWGCPAQQKSCSSLSLTDKNRVLKMGCDQIDKLQWFTETQTHTCTQYSYQVPLNSSEQTDLYIKPVWWKFAAKDCGYAFAIICFRKGKLRMFNSLNVDLRPQTRLPRCFRVLKNVSLFLWDTFILRLYTMVVCISE